MTDDTNSSFEPTTESPPLPPPPLEALMIVLRDVSDRIGLLEDALVERVMDEYLGPGPGRHISADQSRVSMAAHRAAVVSMRALFEQQRTKVVAAVGGDGGPYARVLGKVMEGMDADIAQTERRIKLDQEASQVQPAPRNIKIVKE